MQRTRHWAALSLLAFSTLGCGSKSESNRSPSALDEPAKLEAAVARSAEDEARAREAERKALRGRKLEEQ